MNKTELSGAKGRLSDGIWRQNVVLMSGLVAGPVIAGATNFEKAAGIVFVFTMITSITVVLCRRIPRQIVYTLRIILYAAAASLVYIPTVLLLERLMGVNAVAGIGIYLPILIANPVIISKSETRFFLLNQKAMITELLGYIAGFDIVCLAIGALRDILANGSLGWIKLNPPVTIPALETTFGGFLLVGLLAGLARALYNRGKREA